MDTNIPIDLNLPEDEAYAMAELCKRLSWRDARDLSVDDREARTMLRACDHVRIALAKAGFSVR
ncbi:DUF7706 family protein [Variovorax ureilyticus]|uniref:DUF7706 family protein n=1 Tax=Variovorax ureilyticus TaxID=1836198 RepID=UPI003D670DFC